MRKRDYYEVLGVAKDANADAIRRAYRDLARKHHPDVSKAADAQKKFTEIQEAYDVLSDESKRRAYDQYGHDADARRAQDAARARAEQAWGGQHRGRGPMPDLDAEDLASVFESIFGPGQGKRGRPDVHAPGQRQRASQPGPFWNGDEDLDDDTLRTEVRVPFDTVWKGGNVSLRVETPGATRKPARARTIDVKVPKGVADGTQLRVPHSGSTNRADPDLVVTVRTTPHPFFRRGEFEESGRGLDVYIDLPLSISEATLGATVSVPALGGRAELNIPGGTASGKKLRLRGQGLEDASGTKGDLYVVVRIVPPQASELTDEERRVLGGLGTRLGGPRAGSPWS